MSELRPIFIVGAARSGTTMLGSILGSAAGSLATPESQFISALLASTELPDGYVSSDVARSRLAVDPRFRIWGIDADAAVPRGGRSIRLRHLVEGLVLAYAARSNRSGITVWVDHTPESLFILPCLIEMFPDARVLHLVRDGRAVGASVLPLDWGAANILDAATSWIGQVAAGLAAETSPQFEGRIRRVYYERLVSDPIGTVAEVCEFCKIPFDESMIEGKGFLVPRYTLGQHALVGVKPQISQISKWRSQLSQRQIEIFEAQAGSHLRMLGYETDYWPSALAPTSYEAWAFKLRKALLRPFNMARRKYRAYRHLRQVEQIVVNR